MKTTLRELKGISFEGLDKLTSNLDTEDLDTEVTILEILNICGIKHTTWALGTQKYKDYCLFLAEIAESVLHIFEEKHPNDNRPRKAIEGVRLFYTGKITECELDGLRKDVYYAVGNTIGYKAIAAADAAYYAAARGATYCAHNASYSTARVYNKKWKGVEMILRKHLKENLLDDDLFVI